jgi:hypothetical protein
MYCLPTSIPLPLLLLALNLPSRPVAVADIEAPSSMVSFGTLLFCHPLLLHTVLSLLIFSDKPCSYTWSRRLHSIDILIWKSGSHHHHHVMPKSSALHSQ